MNSPPLKSLRLRLLLLTLAALLPVLALLAYLVWLDTQDRIEQERVRAGQMATLLARDQVLPFALGRQVLEGLARSPALVHPVDEAACRRALGQAVAGKAFLTGIALFSTEGKALCASADIQLPDSNRDYLKNAVRLGQAVVGDFIVCNISGRDAVGLALPVLDEKGAVSSVLAAGLDLEQMGRALAELPVPAGTNIVLVDSRGTVLAPQRWLGRSVADHPVFRRISGITAETSFEARGIDGVERIFVARPINPAAGGQTYLWVAVPRSAASGAAQRGLLGDSSLVLATVLAFFIALWWAGSRLVLRPVERLREAAARLGQAQPSARTGLPHTQDALGQLAAAFDQMAESIETRQAEYHRSQESLLRANRTLRVLSAVKDVIAQAADEPALFDELCRTMAAVGGYPTAYIARAEDDPEKSVAVVAAVGMPEEFRDRLGISWADNERGRGVAGTAIREDRVCVIHDVRSAPGFAPWRELALRMGYESVIGLPVRFEGRVWGVLALSSTQAGVFDEEETCLLMDLAGDLGRGIGALRLRAEKDAADEALRRANAELDRRVRERTEALERANRELEAFSYSISHDLRAPLRSMDGFAQVLDEDYGARLDGEGREHLARIRKAAQRMGQLIDDVIELARISRSEMVLGEVDLSALAAEICAELASAQPQRRLRAVIAPGISARGDRSLLRVLLQNLLENAWKYTAKCDEAEIEFGRTQPPSGEPDFFVRDNGAGFDMAYADRLFRPFSRLHNAEEYPGTGIGLATVARIVGRHGGRVWTESAKGRGTTIHFTL